KQIAAVFALLALIAVTLGLLAFRNQQIAKAQSEKIEQSSSRSEFLAAIDLIQRDRADQALAHLARAVRLDPNNAAAFLRLYTLLGQRAWPLPLRTFPNDSAARDVHLFRDH